MALVLRHQTAAEFVARFRARFRTAQREECMRMAWWLIERINAGDVTDLQVRNAFGLTVTQYNNLKTRLTNMHTAWTAVRNAAGE